MRHPIEVSSMLAREWAESTGGYSDSSWDYELEIARKAAEWQLDKCCEWLSNQWRAPQTADSLRIAMRPKAPSLKEQALADLDDVIDRLLECGKTVPRSIRRAIESIPDAYES